MGHRLRLIQLLDSLVCHLILVASFFKITDDSVHLCIGQSVTLVQSGCHGSEIQRGRISTGKWKMSKGQMWVFVTDTQA